jgi:hypothetical protein
VVPLYDFCTKDWDLFGVSRYRDATPNGSGDLRVFRRDEVVRLRDVERMSWRAIAAALNVPVMTAVDAYRRTEIVSDGAISGDGSDSTSSVPNDAYDIDRLPYAGKVRM